MANTCITQFQLIGTEETLQKIADFCEEKEKWVDDILSLFGQTMPEGLSTRGRWTVISDVESYEEKFRLAVVEESAWSCTNTAKVLRDANIGLDEYYFYEDECGSMLFCTNDQGGLFFPERYRVYLEDHEDERFVSLDDALEYIYKESGKTYSTIDEANEDDAVEINEIEIVADIDE